MNPEGKSLIAGKPISGSDSTFAARFPRTGEILEPQYGSVSEDQLRSAVKAARSAFDDEPFDFSRRAKLLSRVAELLVANGSAIIERANLETSLGQERLNGELARTVGQFETMADAAAKGERRTSTVDSGEPRLQRALAPLGVVAVFAASNFPLAFGVAGTDTATALGAGCTVVAKAHPSQPGTAELCAHVISRAIKESDLPSGLFSVIHEADASRGIDLVTHPDVDAVAFTGSHAGGMALFRATQSRERPIPVYAEMGSLNPVVVTNEAAEVRHADIAEELTASYQLSAGQFCTKPGLVIVPSTPAGDRLIAKMIKGLDRASSEPLLNSAIAERFERDLQAFAAHACTTVHRNGDGSSSFPQPAIAELDANEILNGSVKVEEIFGPLCVVTRATRDEVLELIRSALEPSLTAAIYFEDTETDQVRPIVDQMARMAGRVIANGPPTGVRVSVAMHHGGPYPATTSPRHSSVGTTAMDRFLRPVAFQNLPASIVPSWVSSPGGKPPSDNG